jgi:hypothetical protein
MNGWKGDIEWMVFVRAHKRLIRGKWDIEGKWLGPGG